MLRVEGRHISHSISELSVDVFCINPERSHGIITTIKWIPQIHFRKMSKTLGMHSRSRSLYRRKMANDYVPGHRGFCSYSLRILNPLPRRIAGWTWKNDHHVCIICSLTSFTRIFLPLHAASHKSINCYSPCKHMIFENLSLSRSSLSW